MAIYRRTPRPVGPAQKSAVATIARASLNDDALGNLTIFERVGLSAQASAKDHQRAEGSVAEHFGIDQSNLYKPPS